MPQSKKYKQTFINLSGHETSRSCKFRSAIKWVVMHWGMHYCVNSSRKFLTWNRDFLRLYLFSRRKDELLLWIETSLLCQKETRPIFVSYLSYSGTELSRYKICKNNVWLRVITGSLIIATGISVAYSCRWFLC